MPGAQAAVKRLCLVSWWLQYFGIRRGFHPRRPRVKGWRGLNRRILGRDMCGATCLQHHPPIVTPIHLVYTCLYPLGGVESGWIRDDCGSYVPFNSNFGRVNLLNFVDPHLLGVSKTFTVINWRRHGRGWTRLHQQLETMHRDVQDDCTRRADHWSDVKEILLLDTLW